MISIVVPCYNESPNISTLLSEISENLRPLGEPYEVLFVDDGSVDETLEVLKRLPPDSKASYISLSRNFGHQLALKAGLDHARGDVVITMDGDLQHPPRLIPTLLAKWREGYTIVNTVRQTTQNAGWFKSFTSRRFYWAFEKLSGIPLAAGSADFRLLDQSVVKALREFKEPHLFLRGLVHWVGFKSTTVPYDADPRLTGQTKFTLSKMLRFALDGLMAFSITPLRVAGVLGLLISFLAAGYITYGIYIALFTPQAIPGWASILVSVLFLGGIQMIFLGLLGEYVGKTFMEGKQRPQYLIKELSLRGRQ